jgi:polysaccharide biosynthesis protein PelA
VAGAALYDAPVARLVQAVITTLLASTLAAPALAAQPVASPRAVLAPAPRSPSAKERLTGARTFSFALGARLNATTVVRLGRHDLVVVDGEDATRAQIAAIRRRGALVLGYLSVGSVESWRSWFASLKDHRLEPLGDWDGERYADVSAAPARDALADQIAPALLAKGFDGLFLDNVDMIETHQAQAAGMLDLVTRLSQRVHAAGQLLMGQNGDSIIGPYLPLLDAWNREDPTGTYDFARKRYVLTDAAGRAFARHTLKSVRAAGVVTTTTDYFASTRSRAARRAIRTSCATGAIPTVADIALERVPRKAIRCP